MAAAGIVRGLLFLSKQSISEEGRRLSVVDLENGVFMEQVEDLVERKRWPDLRDML